MYYLYKVTYWSTYDSKEKSARGFVHAKNYGKASMKVLREYGEDCVIDIYLQELDLGNTIDTDEIEEALK